MAVSKKLMAQLEKIDSEKVLQMSIEEVSKYLVDDLKLFNQEKDLKLFILEYLGKAFFEDNVEWPVRYYEGNEKLDPISEEMLTDDFIKTELKGV